MRANGALSAPRRPVADMVAIQCILPLATSALLRPVRGRHRNMATDSSERMATATSAIAASTPRQCDRCGAPVFDGSRRRRAALASPGLAKHGLAKHALASQGLMAQDAIVQGSADQESRGETLCLACGRRARRSAYFRGYYETHKDRILTKNRRWAKDNRDRLVQLRRARQVHRSRAVEEPRRCLDCSEEVVRAVRCRRCYTRYRYATDPDYRVRRLETTRRWLERRREGVEEQQEQRRAGKNAPPRSLSA